MEIRRRRSLLSARPATNILLLNDQRPDDRGMLTDTIIIASINAGGAWSTCSPRDLFVYAWLEDEQDQHGLAHGESTVPGGGFGLMQETLLYNSVTSATMRW